MVVVDLEYPAIVFGFQLAARVNCGVQVVTAGSLGLSKNVLSGQRQPH